MSRSKKGVVGTKFDHEILIACEEVDPVIKECISKEKKVSMCT